MKVARFHKFGGPKCWCTRNPPSPRRSPARRWCACVRWASTTSTSTTAPGTSRIPVTFPHILGREFAGEVAD